mmetsp:Transcript_23458/g.29906  ORF Transcript_23458/g.29906 Transcript_23458/m.29906 type:complete len:94 (+) Transcript_23458:299-580(+)
MEKILFIPVLSVLNLLTKPLDYIGKLIGGENMKEKVPSKQYDHKKKNDFFPSRRICLVLVSTSTVLGSISSLHHHCCIFTQMHLLVSCPKLNQ